MLRAGVIGLGVGERHIYGYNSSLHAKTVRICDIDPIKLADVSDRSGVADCTSNPDEVLFDPTIDVVSIASYDEHHVDQVVKALDNKKHVFVEKPLCLDRAQLEEIRAAFSRARSRGCAPKVSSNFILRSEPRFVRLKDRIMRGDLGEIFSIEGSYDYGRIKKLTEGWRALSPGYSVMHGGGIHVLDLCQWLTGSTYTPHAALAGKTMTVDTPFRPADTIISIGHFGPKTLGKVNANFGSQTPHFHQVKVYGTKGSFIHDCGVSTYYFGSEPEVRSEVESLPFPASQKGDLLPDFVAAIESNQSLEVDFEYIDRLMATSILIDEMANQ